MKAKIILFVFMLGLASSSFGIVIGDFEGGLDGWYANGTNTMTMTATGATVGAGAVQPLSPDPDVAW